ncbi:MAG: HAD family phosphatase [Lachnospiraceae bacterium]|nr:HAD family phosphatase [Lachnospiraceae bacterium]
MVPDIKAVIFDLDGTVFDSMWVWRDIDRAFMVRIGVDALEEVEAAIEGLSFIKTAEYFKERFDLTEDIKEITDNWNRDAFDKYANEVSFKPGCKEFLTFLHENGIKCGLATSNNIKLARVALENNGVIDYFDEIKTGEDVVNSKPAPDIYLAAAQGLGVKPEHCLVCEDLVAGITAGKTAGMKTCAIYDEYSKDQTEEKQSLADYFIKDYRELLAE